MDTYGAHPVSVEFNKTRTSGYRPSASVSKDGGHSKLGTRDHTKSPIKVQGLLDNTQKLLSKGN